MSFKLSAVALGITLAFGATAAMSANDAAISQNGNYNDSSIEQFSNQGAYASITTYGSDNKNVVRQEDTSSSTATMLTNWGNNNDNYIRQQNVNNSSADVYQGASFSKTSITQDGTSTTSPGSWHRPGQTTITAGSNHVAQINQYNGWGHDASIIQTGYNVNSTINQSGNSNTAVSEQVGSGGGWDASIITQKGSSNNAYVNQTGSNQFSEVYQDGVRNVAVVYQAGSGMNSAVSQVGNGNRAYVNQR